MAQNTITLEFRPCRPTPVNGYRVTYREVGVGSYIQWPTNFLSSPAIFTVEGPDGASYEGFIRSDCGEEGLGFEVPWFAENVVPQPSESEVAPSDSEPVEEQATINWQFSDLANPGSGVFSIVVDGIQQVATFTSGSGQLFVAAGASVQVTMVGAPSTVIRTLDIQDETDSTTVYSDSAATNQTHTFIATAGHVYAVFGSVSNP